MACLQLGMRLSVLCSLLADLCCVVLPDSVELLSMGCCERRLLSLHVRQPLVQFLNLCLLLLALLQCSWFREDVMLPPMPVLACCKLNYLLSIHELPVQAWAGFSRGTISDLNAF